jgi:integrase
MLLSKGVHHKYVQQLLGHASIQLTLDRHSHWTPTMGKHTDSAMEDALDGYAGASEADENALGE